MSAAAKPECKRTLDRKVGLTNAPEGITIYALVDTAVDDEAVFHHGRHVGYLRKRTGYSPVSSGRMYATEFVRRTGFRVHDLRGQTVATVTNRADALNAITRYLLSD